MGVGTRGPAWALGGAYTPHHSSLLDVLGSEPGGPPLDGPALTVALDVVQAWAVLITVGFTLVLFVFLAFCVCAKKDDGYDEYELSQGLTTVKVCHDGGENGLSSYPRINGSNTPKGSDEASEASSRCTLKRELPAIPLSAHPDPSAECNVERTQSQHSSDLYAAVGDVNDASGIAKVIGGVQVLPSGAIGPGGRAAVLRDPNVTSPTDSSGPTTSDGPGVATSVAAAHPYAKVKKEHPYAHVKLPKKDHPYAKVVRDDSEDPETDTDNYDDPKAIAKDKNSGWDTEATYEAAPPVPEKRFDLEEETAVGSGPPADSIVGGGGLMTTSVTSASSALGPSSPRSPLLSARVSMTSSAHSPTSPHSTGPSADRPPSADIPAAMAISGRTPANEELPYMTPPLHHQNGTAGIELPVQQNFSGDSQDSRGYTSISVREPLAALKAQTQGTTATTASPATQPHEGEGYYMTVSDDSADEMYACIYEGSRGVGSETYAQIEPRSTPPPPPPPMPSPPHAPSTPSPLSTRGGSQPPPAPPSVDSLRHVVHSRQASSSSAASTVMGSPGAEKRGTRSPLPPLPQGDTSLYSGPSPQPPHSPPRAAAPPAERPTQRALEEMYAKVMKKQRPGHSRGDSSGGGESDAGSVSSSRRGSVDIGGARWGSHASTPPTTPRQSLDLGAMTHSLIETRNLEVVTNISRAKSYEAAGVWGGAAQHPPAQQGAPPNPNYETIPQLPSNFYSGGSSDPGYETVKNAEPPYASVERPEETYPGYETFKLTSDVESEPGYETLKHREYEAGYETVTEKSKQPSSEPGYETVAHEGSQEEEEPGYETVTHHRKEEAADPGYEIVKGKTGVELADPGYEELQGAIHHARTTSEHDPNYEQLKFSSRRSSDGDAEPGYEVVKKVEAESTYEMVRDYDTQERDPTYEKIDKPDELPSPSETPMYASVIRKGSPEKKAAKDKSPEVEEIGPSPVGKKQPAAEEAVDTKEEESIPPPLAMKQPSPPLQKSPSPPLRKSPSPVLRKSPSPPMKQSPEERSPLKQSPDEMSPKKSPDKASVLAKSPDKVSPVLARSPERDSPPLMKSPVKEVLSSTEISEKEMGYSAIAKSPEKGSPTLMKSPEKEQGSPLPIAKSPEKESPPVAMSLEKESSSQVRNLEEGSPDLTKTPLKESPVTRESPEKEFAPPMPPTAPMPSTDLQEGIPERQSSVEKSPVVPVLTSVAQSFPTPIKSPEASLSDDDVVLGMTPDKKSVAFDDSPDKTFSPSSDSSDEESLSEKFPQQKSPPKLESPVREQSSLEKEGPVQHPSSQSPTKVTDPSAQESHVEAESLVSDVNENASITSGDSEKFPAPPQVSSPDRTSTAAFDSLGTQDGIPVPETQSQPQETINPLYMVGENSNQQQSMMQETSTTSQVVSVGLCGDLPPPPPVEEDEAAFPNDLPPPLPEVTSFMPSNDTLAEEAPPPPLVSPSDVEGLEDMLPLAHMGSSSSGSTAGQPGSIHGSSEKDSDSPQESEDTQMEGTIVADDLPPPPMATTTGSEQDSDEELDNSVSSGYEHGFTAGGITVTVNPMADMEETQEATDSLPPPPPSEPSPVAPPSPIAVSAVVTSSAGSQSSSNGSGSQDTGSGSVESVVTVECAVAGDPRVQDRQRSTDSSSSPESRHVDPNEQITEV